MTGAKLLRSRAQRPFRTVNEDEGCGHRQTTGGSSGPRRAQLRSAARSGGVLGDVVFPPFPRGRRVGAEDRRDLLLPISRRLPKRIVHDPEMRHFGPDPLAFRIRPRDALAGRRVFDETLPVPHQHAGIAFIIEDAGAARNVASNARVAPGPVQRGRECRRGRRPPCPFPHGRADHDGSSSRGLSGTGRSSCSSG